MARIRKASQTIKNDVLDFIIKNRKSLTTKICHGSEPVQVVDNILIGGHFKLRSAFKVAKLTDSEIKLALE